MLDKPTILVVDDSSDNLTLLNELLSDKYDVKVAKNGEIALRIAHVKPHPDLILLDVVMPVMDGFETCKKLKENPDTKYIPVIFLTAKSAIIDEEMGFNIGAVDYIMKPISPPVLKARVNTHLSLKNSADFLRDKNDYLESEIAKRTQQLEVIQNVTIMTLSSLAETRDNETGAHIIRTQYYVKDLAEKLVKNNYYSDILTPNMIDLLYKSAPLHDIGKVGIPDHILLKPGKLTVEEMAIMKTHPSIGLKAIEQAEMRLGTDVAFLKLAKVIAYSHHEKWNGSGYPLGLTGEDIPLAGRLMAVADVYDALISRRIYKPGKSHEEAIAIIVEGKGTHFDPILIDLLVNSHQDFANIAHDHPDSDDVSELESFY